MSFLCRLGFHQWYVDAAMFHSAARCAHCDEYEDKSAGAALDLEREMWADGRLTSSLVRKDAV